jgi:glycosyltransferase involved in cell wall biosynthesis
LIACFSKNERAGQLFSALARQNPEYTDLGVCRSRKAVKYVSAALSIQPDREQWYTDTTFSPLVAREMERQGSALLRRASGLSAILYWGAMNFPALREDMHVPYFIVTDGPFDPGDPTYIVEWSPKRWRGEYFRRQRAIYRGARHVFALTDWARDKIMRLHDLPEDRVTRIGWGPVQESVKPNLRPAEPGFFISLGHHWHCKGMDIVAEAGARFHAAHPEAWTLIAGRPRGFTVPERKGVVQIPHAIPGPVSQLLISQARALILVSRFESAGHVVYEALQAGTPVIGSRVCGLAEALRDPRCGFSIPAGDAGALAEAMEKVWAADPLPQREAAVAGYKDAGGWARSAEIVERQIQSALQLGVKSDEFL